MQGSNGEFAYMDPDERVELVKKVREFAPKEKLIIAGAACEGIEPSNGQLCQLFLKDNEVKFLFVTCS